MLHTLLVAAALLSAPSSDTASFAACRKASRPTGACVWRHGWHVNVNGWYFSRLAVSAGRRRDLAISQPGAAESEFTPAAEVAAIRRHSWFATGLVPVDAWQGEGEYLVCPLPQPRGDWVLQDRHLTVVCLAGARRIVAHVDVDLLPDRSRRRLVGLARRR